MSNSATLPAGSLDHFSLERGPIQNNNNGDNIGRDNIVNNYNSTGPDPLRHDCFPGRNAYDPQTFVKRKECYELQNCGLVCDQHDHEQPHCQGGVLVLHGFPGCGKTTLSEWATQQTHQNCRKYLFRVPANLQIDELRRQYGAFGRAMGINLEESNAEDVIAVVVRKLSTSRNWLLIFQDVELQHSSRCALPTKGVHYPAFCQGLVIITTSIKPRQLVHNAVIDRKVIALEISGFTRTECEEFFRRGLERHADELSLPGVERGLKELGTLIQWHPLALDLIVGYLLYGPGKINLEARLEKLLEEQRESTVRWPDQEPTYSMFETQFELLKKMSRTHDEGQNAQGMLTFLAHAAPGQFSTSLLNSALESMNRESYWPGRSKWWKSHLLSVLIQESRPDWNRSKRQRAIQILDELHLIQSSDIYGLQDFEEQRGDYFISLHPLIANYVRQITEKKEEIEGKEHGRKAGKALHTTMFTLAESVYLHERYRANFQESRKLRRFAFPHMWACWKQKKKQDWLDWFAQDAAEEGEEQFDRIRIGRRVAYCFSSYGHAKDAWTLQQTLLRKMVCMGAVRTTSRILRRSTELRSLYLWTVNELAITERSMGNVELAKSRLEQMLFEVHDLRLSLMQTAMSDLETAITFSGPQKWAFNAFVIIWSGLILLNISFPGLVDRIFGAEKDEQLLTIQTNYAAYLADNNEHLLAFELRQRVLRDREMKSCQQPGRPDFDLIVAMKSLADSMYRTSRRPQALHMREKALLLLDRHPATEAREYVDKWLTQLDEARERTWDLELDLLSDLSESWLDFGNNREASEIDHAVYQLRSQRLPADHFDVLDASNRLSESKYRVDHDAVYAYLLRKRNMQLLSPLVQASDYRLLLARMRFAEIQAAIDPESAEKLMEDVLRVQTTDQNRLASFEHEVRSRFINLLMKLPSKEKRKKACRMQRDIISMRHQCNSQHAREEHVQQVRILGDCLYSAGEHLEALQTHEKALQLIGELEGDRPESQLRQAISFSIAGDHFRLSEPQCRCINPGESCPIEKIPPRAKAGSDTASTHVTQASEKIATALAHEAPDATQGNSPATLWSISDDDDGDNDSGGIDASDVPNGLEHGVNPRYGFVISILSSKHRDTSLGQLEGRKERSRQHIKSAVDHYRSVYNQRKALLGEDHQLTRLTLGKFVTALGNAGVQYRREWEEVQTGSSDLTSKLTSQQAAKKEFIEEFVECQSRVEGYESFEQPDENFDELDADDY